MSGPPSAIRPRRTPAAALLAAALALCLVPGSASSQVWRQDQLLIGGWGITQFGDRRSMNRRASAISLVDSIWSAGIESFTKSLMSVSTNPGHTAFTVTERETKALLIDLRDYLNRAR